MSKFVLTVNGVREMVDVEADTPLLYVLHDHLELNGPKFGCGISQCGSCAVLLNGQLAITCTMPVSAVGEAKITTLDGLADSSGKLHTVQEPFLKEQADQCGYCLNGMIMATVALLDRIANPDDAEIKKALELHLCRCGAQTRMIRAIKTAANNL